MDHLDKLIPLAILSVVGALLAYLLRRAARELTATPPTEAASPLVVPEPIAAPAVVENVITATLAVPEPVPQNPPPVLKKKRKKVPVAVVEAPAVQTPIVAVLDLLKKRDSLATAFLLREILAPPVSKRH